MDASGSTLGNGKSAVKNSEEHPRGWLRRAAAGRDTALLLTPPNGWKGPRRPAGQPVTATAGNGGSARSSRAPALPACYWLISSGPPAPPGR